VRSRQGGRCTVPRDQGQHGSYTDSFYFVIGDYGNTNTGSNTLTSQLAILYSSPTLGLVITGSGNVQMQYGYGTGSDERIKTNIKTIENALDKLIITWS
jgi:hypothetical protein